MLAPRARASLILVTLLGACPAPRPSSSGPSRGPGTAPAVPDLRAACAEEIRRELTCEADFVPMIVDARIRLDLPPGMAARARGPDGRDGLVAEARAEFAEDYAPDRIETICNHRQARAASLSPEALEDLRRDNGACTGATDCRAFTACMAPILEKLLRLGVRGT